MGIVTYFAAGEVNEDIIGEDDCDVGLGGSFTLVYSPSLLCVDSPGGGLSVFGDLKLEDAVGLKPE